MLSITACAVPEMTRGGLITSTSSAAEAQQLGSTARRAADDEICSGDLGLCVLLVPSIRSTVHETSAFIGAASQEYFNCGRKGYHD